MNFLFSVELNHVPLLEDGNSSREGSLLLVDSSTSSWSSVVFPAADAPNFGLSAGGRLTFNEVLVAVELSFKLSTPIEVSREFSCSWASSGGFCVVLPVITVAFRSVLLSGELGRLGSALSHVLVLELVFGVVVEPIDGVFILELESELTFVLKFAVVTGKCSCVRTF